MCTARILVLDSAPRCEASLECLEQHVEDNRYDDEDHYSCEVLVSLERCCRCTNAVADALHCCDEFYDDYAAARTTDGQSAAADDKWKGAWRSQERRVGKEDENT